MCARARASCAALAATQTSIRRLVSCRPPSSFHSGPQERWCATSTVPITPLPSPAALPEGFVTVHFIDANCERPPRRISVQAPIGSSLVDVAKKHGVDVHAACGQKLQCATCHLILTKPFYEYLQPPGVREEDLLDSTFTLTPTSRLGCQVKLTKQLDGIECTLPDSGAKGLTRMSMNQPRPKIEKQWTAVPAVPPNPHARHRPMVSPGPSMLWNGSGPMPGLPEPTNGAGMGLASASAKAAQEESASLRKDLGDQRSLAARLESELRQLRSSSSAASGSSGGKEKGTAKNTNSDGGQGSEDDDELAKVKAELANTRVDVGKLGRRVGFEDVIGLELAKRALREAVVWPALADQALFSGIRGAPKGLLLYGPPGCGKTMLARAAAAELGDRAAFFHVRPGDVMSKYYGDSQKRVQALEELVQEAAPAVVFFDEVDTLVGSRDTSGTAEFHRATTNALLAWMDGFGTGEERVFFLGATNRPEAIDEAALRRFGEAAEVEAPCVEARLSLLRHLVFTKAAEDGHRADVFEEDLQAIAEKTDGYSLADVDRLVRRAFLVVLRQLPGPGIRPGLRPADVPPVTRSHFEAALEEASSTSALRDILKKKAKTRAAL